MNIKSKRLLSVLLILTVLFSTLVAVNITANDEEEPVAFMFRDKDYRPQYYNNKPTTALCSNDGSLRIQSDQMQKQYQMAYEITGSNLERLSTAIDEANEYYNGLLSMIVRINKATNKYNRPCSPEIVAHLVGATSSGAPNLGDIISTTGYTKIASESYQVLYFNVEKFSEEEYNNQAKYVYVQAQCYDWACGSDKEDGGTIPDITFFPIRVDTGAPTTVPPISTEPIDPDQVTVIRFGKANRTDYANAPDTIRYSSDGSNWKSEALVQPENYGYVYMQKINQAEQMQASFSVYGDDYEAAKNAINVANAEGGTGKLRLRVTLQRCIDPYGNSVPAEIKIQLDTEKGNQPTKPDPVVIEAWQYPGTSRNYFIDISQIKHISQISAIVVRAQNYWYYNKEGKLFDWDKESNYAGEEAANALGYKKCYIKPTMIVSPVTTLKNDGKTYNNTAYDLVLNDFNKNGKVPDVITIDDPNANEIPEPSSTKPGETTSTTTTTTKTTATTVAKPATPKMNTVKYVASGTNRAYWYAAKNAKAYRVYRKVNTGSWKYLGATTKTYYTDKKATTGGTYYYRVVAVNGTQKSSYSSYKYIKIMGVANKPVIKLSAGKKYLKVSFKTKVTNATGYRYEYSLYSNMKSKKTSTSATIKGLKSGKYYYVRSRAYKKVGSKVYWSKYSSVVKVKVK